MSSRSSAGLPTQPARFGASANGSGFSENAVQFIAFDPAGGDNERAWRIKDLRDFAPAGSSSVRGPFALSFDTPGLTAGVTFYTPTVNDILLDAWVEVDTAWDGTTPKFDFGTFVGTTAGLFKKASASVVDLGAATDESAGTGVKILGLGSGNPRSLSGLAFNPVYASGTTVVPARFTAANPLKVVVSQTGAKDGADPGSAQGAARLYVVTATPSPF